MIKSFKIVLCFLSCIILVGCASDDRTDFEKKYQIDNHDVQDMTYSDLLDFVKDQSGLVFIGQDNGEAQALADVFCANLCKCEVNKLIM